MRNATGDGSRSLRFVDLFAGLGGFHVALSDLGHTCVFASEINPDLQKLYKCNFLMSSRRVYGDIRKTEVRDRIPAHDILCAGFPCQPFSKSGYQLGWADKDRGTLFWSIWDILRRHNTPFVLLENVGNFERHDGGRTWRSVRASLEDLGYAVAGTSHRLKGGPGLISPHHLGYAHSRERFFIVASRQGLPANPFPERAPVVRETLADIVDHDLCPEVLETVAISPAHVGYIDHWNALVTRLPEGALPSFPLWGDEFWADYEYTNGTPHTSSLRDLRSALGRLPGAERMSRDELLSSLPPYATDHVHRFPPWKQRFIQQNREWYRQFQQYISEEWLAKLRTFPFSHRKLEWNLKGGEQDLWKCVLQFRPSGIRAKRYTTSPSLVAMTMSQIPILGPERRFLTIREGMRLQGFDPDRLVAPANREKAFQALGNAVHTGVAREIARRLVGSARTDVETATARVRQLRLAEPTDRRNGSVVTGAVPPATGRARSRHS